MAFIPEEILPHGVEDVKGPVISARFFATYENRVCPWHTTPLFGGSSFEEDVLQGDEVERAHDKNAGLLRYSVPLTINRLPAAVASTLWYLMEKNKELSTISAVSRYASRAGLRVMLRVGALSQLDKVRREVYERGEDSDLGAFIGRSWAGFRALSAEAEYRKLACFGWVSVVVGKVAILTGLPSSTIGLATIIAGLAQSVDWVPEPYVERFAVAFLRFVDYLEGRARSLYI